jgi:GNAT superfamily N-acetyltransferase
VLPATPADVHILHELVRALAHYERLSHLLQCTPELLHEALFGSPPAAEALIAWTEDAKQPSAAGYALFFHNFSTFLGRRGLYLEDIYVRPEYRGAGCGRRLLHAVARIATARRCARFEWTVLDWNLSAQSFYTSLGASILPDWRIARVTGDALDRLARDQPAPGS